MAGRDGPRTTAWAAFLASRPDRSNSFERAERFGAQLDFRSLYYVDVPLGVG